jgi:hypothetical protein
MATPHRHGRLITIQELLLSQRESVPTRCTHCGRDGTDRDHERLEAALRARIRMLEAKVYDLEAMVAGQT